MTRPLAPLGLIVFALVLGSTPPAPAAEEPASGGSAVQEDATGQLKSDSAGEMPAFYSPETRQKYAALGDSGYTLLKAGKTDDAIAVFAEMEKVIPNGPWGHYSIACAYGHTGNVPKCLAELELALDAGFDNLSSLENDPDLAQAVADPSGADLLRRCSENEDTHLAYLAQGLPAVTPFTTTVDSLPALMNAEMHRLSDQYAVWHHWQYRQASLNVRARQLETVRAARKDDPKFEYPLYRVRVLANTAPLGERWGVLADGVKKEGEVYLASPGTPAGRSEVAYDLALAAYSRETPDPSSPAFKEAADEARRYLAQVDTTSKQAASATAFGLALDLMEAGPTKEPLYPKVRAFAARYWKDSAAQAIATAMFRKELIEAHWPIPLDAVDLDGKPVSLDDYRGKLLLIDFWATWCSPCLQELPGLRDAYAKYHDRGLEILSVSLDYSRTTPTEKYRAWTVANGMNWRHVYDKKDWKGPLPKGFFIYSIPAPFLIGRDGRPVAAGDELRGDRLAKAIEKALM